MKVMTHKQPELAKAHFAGLLKQERAAQTPPVQQWFNVAQYRPAQFASSESAMGILDLLGFGEEMVRPEPSGWGTGLGRMYPCGPRQRGLNHFLRSIWPTSLKILASNLG